VQGRRPSLREPEHAFWENLTWRSWLSARIVKIKGQIPCPIGSSRVGNQKAGGWVDPTSRNLGTFGDCVNPFLATILDSTYFSPLPAFVSTKNGLVLHTLATIGFSRTLRNKLEESTTEFTVSKISLQKHLDLPHDKKSSHS